MARLPAGTVTFFFTDIEASTRLLQHVGDVTGAQIFADHRRLLRDAFQAGGGYEYQDQSESFLIVFQSAKDAVRSAAAAQRAIATHPWPEGAMLRVRMGLHSGEPVVAADGYVGLDVHRAARICAAGYGGQVLISERTCALIPLHKRREAHAAAPTPDPLTPNPTGPPHLPRHRNMVASYSNILTRT